MDTRAGIIAAGLAACASIASAVATYFAARPKGKAATRTAQAAETTAESRVQEAINSGFEKLTARYEERDEAWQLEVSQLRGEIRDLSQHVESLEKILRENGIPIPQRKHKHAQANGLIVVGGSDT